MRAVKHVAKLPLWSLVFDASLKFKAAVGSKKKH